eukprot:SAG31_NODE_6966_length_1832_cov_1.414310_1_plen_165_part_00
MCAIWSSSLAAGIRTTNRAARARVHLSLPFCLGTQIREGQTRAWLSPHWGVPSSHMATHPGMHPCGDLPRSLSPTGAASQRSPTAAAFPTSMAATAEDEQRPKTSHQEKYYKKSSERWKNLPQTSRSRRPAKTRDRRPAGGWVRRAAACPLAQARGILRYFEIF